jgi:WS/DGAT/MGAT family acyltransferase
VADRLSAMDASFLYLEGSTTPMHVGSVVFFQESPGALDHERLVKLIRERIAYLPRYRQRLREVPGGLAHPVWVDDPKFDVSYHVRRSALPAPGTVAQLYDLVARIMSRPLDRRRPLWEVYLVEGIEGRRFALLTKSHQAMVNGLTAVDIAEVILDESPELRAVPATNWKPSAQPSLAELVAGAIGDNIAHPRAWMTRVGKALGSSTRVVGDVVTTIVEAARTPEHNPLAVDVSAQRRFDTVDLRLEDLKAVRRVLGGAVTDVALAVVTGGLRSWMFNRGVSIDSAMTVRTLVPVGLAADDPRTSRISALLLDLPVGEPDPVVRLQRIAYEMARHGAESHVVGARAMVELVGFAPPTMHAVGARVGSTLARRSYSLIVTNVPGPQTPLYAGGARMLSAYPVIPLGDRQALSIGITSYDGGVFFGLNADRDAVPDLDVLVSAMRESLSELLDTTRPDGGRPLRRVPRKVT